jgi:hypothetical protein
MGVPVRGAVGGCAEGGGGGWGGPDEDMAGTLGRRCGEVGGEGGFWEGVGIVGAQGNRGRAERGEEEKGRF